MYDVAIVGAGIVGLAHALIAARAGKRVIVIDRDSRANGASVRNFGFVTVTGQQYPECWRRARRSAQIWDEVAKSAKIEVVHRGLLLAARRPEAMRLLEAFVEHPMGADCSLMTPRAAQEQVRPLRTDKLAGALWSPHERRVESRTAVPQLARWLAEAHGVAFRWSTAVLSVAPPAVETTAGTIEADTCIVCPGDDLVSLFAGQSCLQCRRLRQLCVSQVSHKAQVRHHAGTQFEARPGRNAQHMQLATRQAVAGKPLREQADALINGVHLIVVQSADGTLVVGDSHHYDGTPDPFAPSAVDALILEELSEVLTLTAPHVTERWSGTYASAHDRLALIDRPDDATRLVTITSGTGASTAFAIAEEVIGELFESQATVREFAQ